MTSLPEHNNKTKPDQTGSNNEMPEIEMDNNNSSKTGNNLQQNVTAQQTSSMNVASN
jgi:hypothetical protein